MNALEQQVELIVHHNISHIQSGQKWVHCPEHILGWLLHNSFVVHDKVKVKSTFRFCMTAMNTLSSATVVTDQSVSWL